MSSVDRRLHERALELAASAIDFALGRGEAAELGAHLVACPACARSAASLRADAVAIRLPALLPSRRVDDAVYAAIARREVRSQRLLVLVAAALLLVALLGVAAAGAFLRIWPTLPIVVQPTAPAVVVDATPSTSPVPSGAPALPTGTLIVYAGRDGETQVVRTVQPDGQQDRTLAEGDVPAWSPDGRSIAYGCRFAEATAAGRLGDICVMDADGAGQHMVVTGGISPSWSPGGTRILFSRSAIDAGDTWVANADGTNARKVGDGTGSWSPDGTWLLLLGASGAAPDATIVRPDGSGARALGECWNATWSPDSRRIACTRWDEVHGQLRAINVADGSVTTLLEADVAISDPAWVSPDKRAIAITMVRPGSSPGALPAENDLHLLDIGTGKLRQLTSGLSITGPMAVSPDGVWLAFGVADGESSDIYLVSTAGNARRLTTTGTSRGPRWQPQVPFASPSPEPSPASGSLPVASGGVQMAPGPDGGLYVLAASPRLTVDAPAGRSVLALLDASGRPRAGWPIALPGWICDTPSPGTSLWAPPVAADGSVRVVCSSEEAPDGPSPKVRAFAFDAAGRALAGWPVDLPDNVWERPRVVDGRLVVIAHEFTEEVSGNYSGAYWLVAVAADGTVRTGARYEIPTDATSDLVELGPDGTAYRTAGTEITAFDVDGVRAGWPIRVEGAPSALAFGSDGRVYLTESSQGAGTSRLLAFDRDGRTVLVGSDLLPVVGASAWSGAGPAGRPVAPLVAADGTAFVIGEAGGRAVAFRIDASGTVMSGWPHRAATGAEWQGSCGPDVAGCGDWRSVPAVGPDGVVYLPLAAPDAQIGGSLVAVGPGGTALPGWPIHLAHRGAAFWWVVVGSDGTVYALAVEPETGGKSSATILAIAKDGTVRSRTTVVAP